jgi:short-subunit dehydrogenase
MENTKYQGQTALVTGATSGIGLELAHCCAQDGYNLIIVARTQEDLDSTAEELSEEYGVSVHTIAADLMDPREAFRVCEEVQQIGIRVDVLINDAGQGVYGAFTGTDIERELDIIQLNVSSFTVLTKFFLKEMVMRDSGKVLQLASIASKSSAPYMAVYGGTKAYIYNFTEALISELEDSKVTVTALLPGPTETDFFDKAGAQKIIPVVENKLADPAKVARDGYEAMQSGQSKIISGWTNKMQSAMGNFVTDEAVVDMAKKQNELSDKA